MKKMTIVTPTYNRRDTLGNCYSSLLKQTCQDFLWMIIDDGSTDRTEDIVGEWVSEGKMEIRYVKKPNGGKASALNLALGLLDTPYTACLDSDDLFVADAVENALKELEAIRDDDGICGVLALRSHEDGIVTGRREIPDRWDLATAEDLLITENVRSEFICFYKTEILTRFRFPEFEGEKFVPPSWMMFSITQEHRYKVSHTRFCICEYTDDGLTRNKKKVIMKNPRGYSRAKLWYFDLSRKPRLIAKHGVMYLCGCLIARDRAWLKNTKRKIWAVLLWPAALFVYLKEYRKKA